MNKKIERLILRNLKLPEDAPGKSWGVPMKGDVLVLIDMNENNEFFSIRTIRNVKEGTRYSLELITKEAAEDKLLNGHCCFSVQPIEEFGHPFVEFCSINKW